ncbi:MAG: metallophosphoesterase family protein [Sporolactobacillus sp.]
MRIAALYDIHGNFPALKAVLDELNDLKPDRVVIGGDIVSGSMPVQTLECLLNLKRNVKVTFIQGNGDREVIEASKGLELNGLSEQGKKKQRWVAEQLTEKQIEFLSSFERTASIHVDNMGNILFCHATPFSDSDIFTPESDIKRIGQLFEAVEQPIIVCGHTHMQFKLELEKKVIFNAGSVGMPFAKRSGAYWFFIDSDQATINFKQTFYDLNLASKLLRTSGDPYVEEFVNHNLLHVPTPREAMEMLNKISLK